VGFIASFGSNRPGKDRALSAFRAYVRVDACEHVQCSLPENRGLGDSGFFAADLELDV
jgi:hypothetical protein